MGLHGSQRLKLPPLGGLINDERVRSRRRHLLPVRRESHMRQGLRARWLVTLLSVGVVIALQSRSGLAQVDVTANAPARILPAMPSQAQSGAQLAPPHQVAAAESAPVALRPPVAAAPVVPVAAPVVHGTVPVTTPSAAVAPAAASASAGLAPTLGTTGSVTGGSILTTFLPANVRAPTVRVVVEIDIEVRNNPHGQHDDSGQPAARSFARTRSTIDRGRDIMSALTRTTTQPSSSSAAIRSISQARWRGSVHSGNPGGWTRCIARCRSGAGWSAIAIAAFGAARSPYQRNQRAVRHLGFFAPRRDPQPRRLAASRD